LYPDELSQEKKLIIAQVLQAKRKIEIKAQRLEAESLLHDKEQLRKILHGCVRVGSNIAKDEKPIRHFFKSSDTSNKIEFIRKIT
jgi:chaperonin GroEL (HSP60 family)